MADHDKPADDVLTDAEEVHEAFEEGSKPTADPLDGDQEIERLELDDIDPELADSDDIDWEGEGEDEDKDKDQG